MNNDKGFTLIELIVVMAIIAILVLLAAPRFLGYTKDANVTAMEQDTKVLADAAEMYHIEKEIWPVAGKIEEFGVGGADEMYYIDYGKLSGHIKNIRGEYDQYGLVTKGELQGEVILLKESDTSRKGNILELSNISIHGDAIAVLNDINLIEMESYGATSGIKIRNGNMMQPNKRYQLSYTYQKVEGQLRSFGGHMYSGFYGYGSLISFHQVKNVNRVYVDGILNSTNYHHEQSAFVGDDTNKHTVVIEFNTDNKLNENDSIYIQPNRAINNKYVKVRITDLKLVEL